MGAIRKLIEEVADKNGSGWDEYLAAAEAELADLHRGGMSVSAEALSLQDEVKALRAEAAQLQRLVAHRTWERDRYRKVVEMVSVLDSVKVQRAAKEVE